MNSRDHANHLAGETSPYLLQHADNPVNWYPWGEEALRLARDTDRPILLSIGYSACHWCHVMAHESFEDPATAALMNELYVNIKVDREERPDLDRIYQTAFQLMTRRPGGWPLTVFLTADRHTPFFAGTYFPADARFGLPAFTTVLERAAEYYRLHRSEVEQQGEAVRTGLAQLLPAGQAAEQEIDDRPLQAARNSWAESFDGDYGGFGNAPKFPQPARLEALLRHWRSTAASPEPDVEALYMVSATLRAIGEGGIRDHLDGGFCRYSVDRHWSIPHFEKMLYDNAALLGLYARVWQASGDDFFRGVAAETGAWLLKSMQSEGGGFYSSIDADSEGAEGRYYVWGAGEIEAALEPQQLRAFAAVYGLDRPANFEGAWHLRICREADDVARELEMGTGRLQTLLEEARATLLRQRRRRPPPALDDKVLTAWNGLAIKGLADAGRALPDPGLCAAGRRAAQFLHRELWRDGRLLATWRAGHAQHAAYLDDYAFLVQGLLALTQADWDSGLFVWATELADVMLAHFEDRESGGFFFTADDHEQLIDRPKVFNDDATPAGNAVAAQVLLRLGYLLGRTDYLQAARRTLQAAWRPLSAYPDAHAGLLAALRDSLYPPQSVIVRSEGNTELAAVAGTIYAPHRMVFTIPPAATGLPEALAEKTPRGEAVAYLCEGLRCSAPMSEAAALAAALRES